MSDNYLNSSDNIGADVFGKWNENRVSIMGTMAKAADTLYGDDANLLDDYGMAKGDYSSALYGTGNYKKGLIYLSWFTSPKYATELEMANGANTYKE